MKGMKDTRNKSKNGWREKNGDKRKTRTMSKKKKRKRDEGRKVEKWNESERNWKQCNLKKGVNKWKDESK